MTPRQTALGGQTASGTPWKPGKEPWLVLYFYPRAMTPGCTREASGFETHLTEFRALGAAVVGVSKDSCTALARFQEARGLTFTLVSDETGALCEAFGVWKEKTLYGRTSMGIERSTFLLDSKREVAASWRKVRVDGHVEAVLATLRGLCA